MGSTTANVLRYRLCVTRDHTVLPATHTQTIPAFTPQPQGITALWLVLIAPTHEGMARLSWPRWPATCRYKCPHWELNPDTVTHLSTNRARCWLTSLIEANALTTTPDRHLNEWNLFTTSSTSSNRNTIYGSFNTIKKEILCHWQRATYV